MKVDKSEVVVDIAKVVEDSEDDDTEALENELVETSEDSSNVASIEDSEDLDETVVVEGSKEQE